MDDAQMDDAWRDQLLAWVSGVLRVITVQDDDENEESPLVSGGVYSKKDPAEDRLIGV